MKKSATQRVRDKQAMQFAERGVPYAFTANLLSALISNLVTNPYADLTPMRYLYLLALYCTPLLVILGSYYGIRTALLRHPLGFIIIGLCAISLLVYIPSVFL